MNIFNSLPVANFIDCYSLEILSGLIWNSGSKLFDSDVTRVIFYVRRIGLYLYKYRIYGTMSIYILKGLAFVYQLI